MRFIFLLAILLSITKITWAVDFSTKLYPTVKGGNLNECSKKLESQLGGWCEIRSNQQHPSISAAWPPKVENKTHMVVGPRSVLQAWNSAAFDSARYNFYFMGGGHADYGGNEVYEFDLSLGKWSRLTDSSPLDKLYVLTDYNVRKKKPWRRLCWVPDFRTVPASAHNYDGLIYSAQTRTLFLYVMGAANGSCFEDIEDKFKNSPTILGNRATTFGWYEFNPDLYKSRNGVPALTWRRVFNANELREKKIQQGYPATAQLSNGDIVFGSSFRTQKYAPKVADLSSLKPFTSQADWGDGTKVFDKKRDIVWSLHSTALLAFSSSTGKFLRKYKTGFPNGKSLAIANDGKLYSWNGTADVSVFDPDGDKVWRTLPWGVNGPLKGDHRVYGKWVYLEKEELFIGLSTHETGVWAYKHPNKPKYSEYSKHDAQKLINNAKPGSKIIIPPGIYPQGLFVNKSLTLGLKGVSLRGIANSKGIINVSCNHCRVVIEDFHGEGVKANCQRGNCAGIKAEGRDFNLVVKRAHIDRTVIGVLTDNRGGELILEDSLIENTGWKDKSSTLGHGFYAGSIDRVVIRNSIIRRPFGDGHIVKSRAVDTLIEGSVIAGLNGYHSRTIDFPCGGKLEIKDSVLQHGANADNIDLISVGTESKACGDSAQPSRVSLTGNWIVIDRDRSSDERSAKYGSTQLFTWRTSVDSVRVSGNIFVEPTGQFSFDPERRVPDMTDQNRFYRSRSDAGLTANQLPTTGNLRIN
ncbi:hypothetical protein [Neptunomonas japonica]|uniref:hypothetical protein n=1 Tax=Neptunomonas japonica TaxID=417574 RepID=UPI0012EC44B4|nr:hypothetical protein [Neptunomonas japonica]